VESTRGNAVFQAPTGVEIRYPVEGAVYFYDPSVPPDTQAVRVEVVHDGAEPSLVINGEVFSGSADVSNRVMTSWIVPLARGVMRLEVRSSLSESESAVLERVVRHIEVR
jgi:hypothetical protein